MNRRVAHHLPILSLSGNLLLLNTIFVLGFMVQYDFFYRSYSQENLWLYAYLNMMWVFVSILSGTLKERASVRIKHLLLADFLSLTFFFILFLLFFQVFEIGYYFQREEVKFVFSYFALSLFLWKLVLFHGYRQLYSSNRTRLRVIIAGYGARAQALAKLFQEDSAAGYVFQGYFDHRPSAHNSYLGNYDDMIAYLTQNEVDEIFFTMTEIPDEYHDAITMVINTMPVNIRFIPNLAGFSHLNTVLVNYDTIPVIEVHQGPLGRFYNRWMKRLFDLSLASVVTVCILSWLIPLLFLANRIGGQGKLFFVQKRSGLNNKTFECIKFRTMKENPEADHLQATENDPRINRFGHFLRKTNIDELPQFLNVLMNQMSVVGPRPHMLAHTEEYKMMADKFMVRQMVKPGITGLAQVRGYRGEIRSLEDLTFRVQLDLVYIERWTLWMDIMIILLTTLRMIKGDKKAY